MKIAVIGAAGRTGRHVVEQALARGDEVIAIARAPERIGLRHDRLELARADVRDRDELTAAIDRADALISALGTRGCLEGSIPSPRRGPPHSVRTSLNVDGPSE